MSWRETLRTSSPPGMPDARLSLVPCPAALNQISLARAEGKGRGRGSGSGAGAGAGAEHEGGKRSAREFNEGEGRSGVEGGGRRRRSGEGAAQRGKGLTKEAVCVGTAELVRWDGMLMPYP